MRIDIPSFRGMAPRMTPRALPPNGAQRAVNARLLSGDLEAWKQFLTVETLSQEPQTIYLLNDTWLSWLTDVDVARGLIPGDDTFRSYLTGPDEYSTPRWTNYTLATSSPGGPAPVTTRPLGVPNPDTIPVVAVVPPTVDVTPTVDVADDGGNLESWVVSTNQEGGTSGGTARTQETTPSSATPDRYVISIDGGTSNNYRNGYFYKDFGVGATSAIKYEFSFQMHGASDSDVRQMCAHVGNPVGGDGIILWYDNILASGKLNISANTGGWAHDGGFEAHVVLAAVDVGVLSRSTVSDFNTFDSAAWYRATVDVSALTDDEQTVTVTLHSGFYGEGAVLGTGTATGRFSLGGYCGHANGHRFDSDSETSHTKYTSIHVTASGERGIVILDVPTNYLFTYVNDVGEESGVYLPSATVTRPDGAAVDVTTSVSLPAYLTEDYSIVSKRLYRSVEGNAGAAFLFVAEIPLTQADYTDTLSDSELGEVLESDLWALPPASMRGIIALPNGIMAGFFGNQLCLSARNNPHAWPVEYRLTTDTDIVAIANIDSIVVIATESFPYLAGGKDPAAFSMRKLDQVPQACVSKRSIAVLSGFGVVYASPDGLIAVNANGQDRNLTETIFTREQWQALVPESILGIVHDDVYHFWRSGVGGGALIFHDSFTGAADTALTAHNVDVGTGPWQGAIGGGGELDGAGGVRRISNTFYGNNTQNFSAFSGAGGFALSMTVQVDALDTHTGSISLYVEGNTIGEADLALFANSSPGTSFIRVSVPAVTNISVADLTSGQTYLVELRVAADSSCRVYLDGVPQGASFSSLLATEGDYNFIEITATPSNAEGGTELHFQDVSISAAQSGSGYALDMKNTGFGLIELGYHASAAHAPPTTDNLYLTLDSVDEPLEAYLPVASTAPTADAATIVQFDGDDASALVYRWRGKLNVFGRAVAMPRVRVHADDYDNLILLVYADGDLISTDTVSSSDILTLPIDDMYRTYEIELVGTSRVQRVLLAESETEIFQPEAI